jgi:phosphopantothenoylcysteine decarboxylase/phosphopantothenate--cysteine ligase
MQHINLVRWADLIILCPATANTLNKLAAGIGDDLVTAQFLAHDFSKPYLVAPAMNTMMWNHAATQSSVEKLQSWGVEFLESGSGALACGEFGDGRLMEPDQIIQEVERRLLALRSRPDSLRVLVTSGGTKEPIDGVRSIANFSSGRTGVAIAEYFARSGHSVTLLRASDSASTALVDSKPYTTFVDLERLLRTELAEEYDVVIHAAAVSDYSVDSIASANGEVLSREGKVTSQDGLTIWLKENPKLLDQFRAWSKNPNIKIVAFKLTNRANESQRMDAVKAVFERAHPEWVVQNDLTEISETQHPAMIYSASDLEGPIKTNTKQELAEALEAAISGRGR